MAEPHNLRAEFRAARSSHISIHYMYLSGKFRPNV